MIKMRMACVICLVACILIGCAASSADMGEDTPSTTAAPLVVDLDLSSLSSTVVYSQVYSMMYEPETYIGKVIRIAGYYSFYEDTERGVVYHACVIPDATACCAQGIEFIWGGEHQWPDDYPKEGTDIIVTGRLETYDEDGYQFLNLVDSELICKSDT